MGRCQQLVGSWTLLAIQPLMPLSCAACLVSMPYSLAELIIRCLTEPQQQPYNTGSMHAGSQQNTSPAGFRAASRAYLHLRLYCIRMRELPHVAMPICILLIHNHVSNDTNGFKFWAGYGGEEGCQTDGAALAGRQVLWRLCKYIHRQLPHRLRS